MNYMIRPSAEIHGKLLIGKGSLVSYGTVVDGQDGDVVLSNNSYILENSYVKGTKEYPVRIGQKTVFGHRCQIIGATIGNCCEIGNGTIFEEGVVMGDFCITGESTYIPKGSVIPSNSVVIGNPYRILRELTEEDRQMIARMRGNNLELVEEELFEVEDFQEKHKIQTLVPYGDKMPKVGDSVLEEEVEIIGDVTIGDHCRIKKGAKLIGDSHGSVTLSDHIVIGEDSVVHLLPDNDVYIHDHVEVGKNCIIHGCVLEERVHIEEGSNICDNARIGRGTRVEKDSLVPQRREIGPGLVVSGSPAKE